MPAPGGSTFDALISEMRTQRFGPSMDSSLKHWVNMREGMVWSDSEWPFKRLRREAVTATNGVLTPPQAYWKTTMLETPSGDELEFVHPDDFNRLFPVGDQSAGAPTFYTVLNEKVYIGPSSFSGTLYLSYDRRMCHYNAVGGITAGPMIEIGDYPLYPVEYHYMLAVGGMASGLKVQNDPTWDSLEQEFQQMLGTMREDLLPPDLYGSNQYGRDDF